MHRIAGLIGAGRGYFAYQILRTRKVPILAHALVGLFDRIGRRRAILRSGHFHQRLRTVCRALPVQPSAREAHAVKQFAIVQ